MKTTKHYADLTCCIHECDCFAAHIEAQDILIRKLREEAAVTDKILAEYKRVLEAIPQCEDHGLCVPHALDWIADRAGLVFDGALQSRNRFRCCGCGKPDSERIEIDCAEIKTFWHHSCWREFIKYVGVQR